MYKFLESSHQAGSNHMKKNLLCILHANPRFSFRVVDIALPLAFRTAPPVCIHFRCGAAWSHAANVACTTEKAGTCSLATRPDTVADPAAALNMSLSP